MNEAQKRAIATALVNAKDDLARATMQKRANPNWRSGNGETIDELISQYQAQVRELEGGQ